MFAVCFGALTLVALCAAAVLASRARELCLRAPIDATSFLPALREHRDNRAALATLAGAVEPAWIAELIEAALQAHEDRAPIHDALDELLIDLRARAFAGLLMVRTLGRIAPPIAFVGAIVELGLAFRHDAGLLSLQKGLAESIAIGHAALAIVTGMTIAVVCRFGARFLSERAGRLMADLRRCANALAGHATAQ